MMRILRGVLCCLTVMMVTGCSRNLIIEAEPRVSFLPGATKLPSRAALLIPPAVAAGHYFGPVEWHEPPIAYTADCDVGKVLAETSRQIFLQYFSEVEVVTSPPEDNAFDFVVEPRFVALAPKMVRAGMASGYGVASVTVHVAIRQGGKTLVERDYSSGEKRGTESSGIEGLEDSLKTATGEAFAAAMVAAATEMAQAPGVRQLAAAPPAARLAPAAVPAQPRFPGWSLSLRFAQAVERPDDVAVIIGNASYGKQGKDIPDVKPAYADAEGMRLYATQALGIRASCV